MLTGRSKRACLRREVPIDHEAHGQRSDGCRRLELLLKVLWQERAPGGQSRTREARSHPYSPEQDGDVKNKGWSVQQTTRST